MIRDTITRTGQRVLDEPVYAVPRRQSAIALSVALAFGHRIPRRFVLRHERVRLNWLKPEDLCTK